MLRRSSRLLRIEQLNCARGIGCVFAGSLGGLALLSSCIFCTSFFLVVTLSASDILHCSDYITFSEAGKSQKTNFLGLFPVSLFPRVNSEWIPDFMSYVLPLSSDVLQLLSACSNRSFH